MAFQRFSIYLVIPKLSVLRCGVFVGFTRKCVHDGKSQVEWRRFFPQSSLSNDILPCSNEIMGK